jgi:hypothetical protein
LSASTPHYIDLDILIQQHTYHEKEIERASIPTN